MLNSICLNVSDQTSMTSQRLSLRRKKAKKLFEMTSTFLLQNGPSMPKTSSFNSCKYKENSPSPSHSSH